ncbi:MAG: PRD domain-containing protein [Erysipelothrix sp.]|nr:PRD domain-containing protein [Erysipelothrix sp.]
MEKIVKILNHNAVIVHEQDTNSTLLILNTGVGFGKKINEYIEIDGIETVYHIQPMSSKGKTDVLLQNLDPIYIEISSDIMMKAKETFEDIDENKLLPLADHIAFAINRMQNKMQITNPFSNEIRLLYPEEWKIAAKSREIIFNKLGHLINDDEIGFITIHLHSTQEMSNDDAFIMAIIVNESIREIEKEYDIEIDLNSLSYSRLMIHMKYLIARLHEDEVITLDMEDYTKESIPDSYALAVRIIKRIEDSLNREVPVIETGYLAMHIDRILSQSK